MLDRARRSRNKMMQIVTVDSIYMLGPDDLEEQLFERLDRIRIRLDPIFYST